MGDAARSAGVKLFESDSIEFMLWLTRAEWQLLHSLSFAWGVYDLMPEHQTMGQAYRHVITELQRTHGYEFDGVRVDADGELWAKTDEPLCRENMLTITLMRRGGAPDYETHLKAALEFAEQRIPGLDREPMRQVLDDLEKITERVKDGVRQMPESVREQLREQFRQRSEAFQSMREIASAN